MWAHTHTVMGNGSIWMDLVSYMWAQQEKPGSWSQEHLSSTHPLHLCDFKQIISIFWAFAFLGIFFIVLFFCFLSCPHLGLGENCDLRFSGPYPTLVRAGPSGLFHILWEQICLPWRKNFTAIKCLQSIWQPQDDSHTSFQGSHPLSLWKIVFYHCVESKSINTLQAKTFSFLK